MGESVAVDSSLADELSLTLQDEMLNNDQIDFNEIRRHDFAKKKRVAHFSGQDVLGEQMNEEKARWVVQKLNSIRVWPRGKYGYLKRGRALLRMLVKSAIFDNFMTFCVLVNTITLGLDRYDISESQSNTLNTFNLVFTIIFCVEMAMKLLALGPKKYL